MDSIEEKIRFTRIILELALEKKLEFKGYSKAAQKRANEAEGAMQSRYDTFKEEGQYLAEGFMDRYEEFRSAVTTIKSIRHDLDFRCDDTVQLYSIIEVVFENGEAKRFFLFPVMAGVILEKNITVITPFSPLGRALIGKEEDDGFHFGVNGKTKAGRIIHVA